ncbi:hypothetical protein FNJ88_04025 [Chryseobacterium sp. SNU WT5]|uniref:hypothetical protein n=1 Tax=Chryseobacterium sp. SNU WT5 TaxID=2594269 RepID=UPI00117ECA63|nr:hypothetical protein [Chryseobacterium sp. SNU WT5]QDP84757.1 hypothetical protein FNJ88_04025 [Chryseobacterium sp. SNU WT5]
MKNLGIPYAIGYIIAGLVLLPLLLFTVNKFFFEGNEVEKHLNLYLSNSEEINMHISPEQEIEMDYERYTAFLARKHGGIIHIRVNTFYSESQKKYFQFRMANISDNFYTAFYNHIKKLNFIITVNKDDINDPKMGTKKHPIPVFKVVGDEKPIRIWHDDKNGKTIYENYDITQQEYEFSVYVHLKYVMSKEEFKERFEKNK